VIARGASRVMAVNKQDPPIIERDEISLAIAGVVIRGANCKTVAGKLSGDLLSFLVDEHETVSEPISKALRNKKVALRCLLIFDFMYI